MAEFFREIYAELQSMFAQGGFVMPPLVGAAVLLWFGIGYRAVMLRRGSKRSVRSLVRRAQGGKLSKPRGFVDAAAVIAVSASHKYNGDLGRVLDDELFELEERLSRFKTLVRTVVLVAPLAGLLGTVSGMIEMFRSLGTQTFYSQSGGVANGISEALLTTQFGLVIAIPGMIVGRLLDRHENKMRSDIQQVKELLIGSTETEELSA